MDEINQTSAAGGVACNGFAFCDGRPLLCVADNYDASRAAEVIGCLADAIRDAVMRAEGDVDAATAYLIQHAADTICGIANVLQDDVERKAPEE